MKYLEDDKLTQWTSELTDAVLAGRVVNGRIEAFTMKRAGTDKKYAHALGEKFVAEMEQRESEMADYQDFLYKQKMRQQQQANIARKRSVSFSGQADIRTKPIKIQRTRATSFDESVAPAMAHSHSPLGDFQEIGTRRLMTDLILTLNASFPDYDFGNSRPFHFIKKSAKDAMEEANGRLSELASRRHESFLREMWNAIDNVICLSETEVFSYVPPAINEDPLGFLTETLLEGHDESATPLWSFNYFFVNKNLKRILLFSCVETMISMEVSDEEDDQMVSVGRYKASEVDFDMDPSADVAGGIPVGM
jgi:hypothetical protein